MICCNSSRFHKFFDLIPLPQRQKEVAPNFDQFFPNGDEALREQAVSFDRNEKELRAYVVESNARLLGLKIAMISTLSFAILAYVASKLLHNHSLNGGTYLWGFKSASACAVRAKACFINSIVFLTLAILTKALFMYYKRKWLKEYSAQKESHNNNIDNWPLVCARAKLIDP